MTDDSRDLRADIVVHDSGGTGPPVVWVHPYTLDGTVWEQLWHLLPDWQHLGLDLPGHGGSRPFAADDDLITLAEATVSLARQVGAHRLVGLSFGSTVALQAALQTPDPFRRIVLGAPAVAGWATDPAAEMRYGQLRSLYAAYGPGPHLTRLWMASPPDIFRGVHAQPELWDRLERLVAQHRWDELGIGTMLAVSAARQRDEQLAKLKAATLVVVGEHDMEAFRTTAWRLSRALPACRAVQIGDAGHLALLERPEVVGPIVDRHLRL